MFDWFSRLSSVFRPTGQALSAEEQTQIQIHRLLTVLAIGFIPLFSLLYDVFALGGVELVWGQFGIVGLLSCLLIASYGSTYLRRYYVECMRGIIFIVMAWFTFVAAVNGFAGNYDMGLLLMYAILAAVMGLGARSVHPVLWFLGFGFVLTGLGIVLGPDTRPSPVILLVSMAVIGVVEFLAAKGNLSIRKQLAGSEARSRAIAESARAAILAIDAESTIHFANPAVEEIFGYDPDELIGEPLTKLMPERFRERHLSGMDRYLQTGEKTMDWRAVEFSGLCKDGTEIDLSISFSEYEQGDEPRFEAVIRDITERKYRERKLKEAKVEAERMNRLKSAFLTNMSHEIRTPLTTILGFAEAIGEEVSPDEDRAVFRFARLIELSGRRLMETLTGVLNLSKLEAGEMSVSTDPLDLAMEVEQAREKFQLQAEDERISLQVDANRPAPALADSEALQIVLHNLMSNAIKYTEEGGQVWVRAYREEEAAVLEVEDTGIGMAPDQKEELFEPFQQESKGTDREYEGAGIGLAVTKRAVETMDGSIELETQKGEGSCFTVRLPLAEKINA